MTKRAIRPFTVYDEKGRGRHFRTGDLVADDDEVLSGRGRARLFEDVSAMFARRPDHERIERATAAPGERKNIHPPTKAVV